MKALIQIEQRAFRETTTTLSNTSDHRDSGFVELDGDAFRLFGDFLFLFFGKVRLGWLRNRRRRCILRWNGDLSLFELFMNMVYEVVEDVFEHDKRL